ncbi:squalene synthase HpnC [uncultured Oxalicibacterium sp.]|uniref:squalene synthase HpnC n=1 Tax=uncultured Oxalicibacterium sp. TaxID=1168540 RepID=UPI0025E9F22D|nr:squalene synthase HpnC [uncultured Oxalicibacterium sp.]
MPVDHYENFPVASILLPAHLRQPVQVIYAFARSADDLADEGDATPEQRLTALENYEAELSRIGAGQIPVTPLFNELAKVIRQHALPLQPFHDLLSAFKQDVVTKRYASFPALLDYCRRSADSVGILMLHLYNESSTDNLQDASAICSALQLINFWQDVALDWHKERIYLPAEDCIRFGVDAQQIEQGNVNPSWQALMQFEISRTRQMMRDGASLALRLPGRIGWELRLVIQGGLRILEKIEAVQYDVFHQRPVLNKLDWLRIVWRALCMRRT